MNPTIPTDLPTIHPLRGDNSTRWTDETETHCGCDYCMHWHPLIKHLRAQLDERGNELLEELVTRWMNESEDLSLARSKLDGSWPGWEAMKDFVPCDPDADDSDSFDAL